MSSRVLNLLTLLGFLAFTNEVVGDSPQRLDRERIQALLDSVIQQHMEIEHVPGAAVAVVDRGDIIFLQGYGLADIENQASVDPETTIFRIGSTTKALTGLAVLQLADQGKLDLEADVNQYLEAFQVDDRYEAQVTLKHLLTHTGGFDQIGTQRLFFDPQARVSLKDFLSRDLYRIRPPGRDSCYDTYGISLAGYVVGRVSGLGYDRYMRERFFEPLGMNRSWVEAPAERRDEMAIGYGWRDGQYVLQPYEYYASTPASSIDTTAQDMAKLMSALLGDGSNAFGRLLSKAALQDLDRPQYRAHPTFPGFTHGFWEMFSRGKRVIYHGGVMQGYSSGLYLIPDDDLGLFIAINRDPETGPDTRLISTAMTTLMEAWYPEPATPVAKQRTRLSIDTQRFAGNYVGNLYCHSRAGSMVWSPGRVTTLRSTEPGVLESATRQYFAIEPLLFEDETGEYQIAFHEDASGRISSCALNLSSPGNTMEKLDDRLLQEVLGANWADQSTAPMTRIVERLNRQAEQDQQDREPPTEEPPPASDSSKVMRPDFRLLRDTAVFAERASTGGISLIDVDGDGDDDVFVTNGYDVSQAEAVPQPNVLYENINGRFVQRECELSEASSFSSGSAWADFDNDGDWDIFIPNQRGQDNLLYRNRGNGSFELLAGWAPASGGGLSFASTWADLDGDSWVDLFVANGGLAGVETDQLYLNQQGQGLMLVQDSPVTANATQSGGATFVDYDLDGDLDLFVAGDPVRMFRNNGSGDLELDDQVLFANEPASRGVSFSGAWGDYDNDGDFDLFQAFTNDEPRRLYVNDGHGNFTREQAGPATDDTSFAFHSMWIDLNQDGFLDLLIANWGEPAQVYLNADGKEFVRAELGELTKRDWYASMVATADYDLDGDCDLFVGNWPNRTGDGEANLVYENMGPVGNSIALRLIGKASNRSAIGARVQVTFQDPSGDQHTVTRDIRSQDGWRGQSSARLIVGIGSADKAEQIRIFWPSGLEQDVGSVRAAETKIIEETIAGKGPAAENTETKTYYTLDPGEFNLRIAVKYENEKQVALAEKKFDSVQQMLSDETIRAADWAIALLAVADRKDYFEIKVNPSVNEIDDPARVERLELKFWYGSELKKQIVFQYDVVSGSSRVDIRN